MIDNPLFNLALTLTAVASLMILMHALRKTLARLQQDAAMVQLQPDHSATPPAAASAAARSRRTSSSSA